MKIIIHKIRNIPVALPEEMPNPVSSTQEMLDLMADAHYRGARKLMLRSDQLHEDFYNLKTGLAGEILQKFSNYYMQLAVVGDFSAYQNKSFRNFMRECNRYRQMFFVENTDEAIKYLTR